MQDVGWLAGRDAPGGAAGRARPEGRRDGPVRLRAPRRRSGARLAAAVVLVLAGWLVTARAADRLPVLAAARGLPAGHMLAAGDFRVVRVSGVDVLAAVPVTGRGSVLGRRLALPLAAGALLTSSVVGSPAGQAVVAVPVKPGQAPPMLQAGDAAGVVVVPDTTATETATAGAPADGPVPAAPRPVPAVVAAVESEAGPGGGERTVSLLVGETDAARVAAAAGDGRAVLVLWAPGT